tara:strand:+ start:1156 stop:1512 length:357 start_codon:yes stop_codon:yes gene_type:complete
MDLSEYTKKIEILPEKVKHDEGSEANEVCITWKHNYLPVSELKYYIRENHAQFESAVADREREILEIWMKELKYDSQYFIVEDKKIKEKGKVEHQDQINNWLKPNSERVLKPTEADEL